jgi:caffeoyl-CoA O-methyltransferase
MARTGGKWQKEATLPMKAAADAVLRPEQAEYLDSLVRSGVRGLAALAGTRPDQGSDPLLARMEARAAERRYPISDPEVAILLSVLVRIARPKLIVELGTNIGYGAIVMGRAADDGARIITVEANEALVSEARGFIGEAGLSQRVEVRHAKALEELGRITESIDLLYVDCVKEEYPRYLEVGAPKLAPRGLVVADNALWMGQVASAKPDPRERERAEALRAFNLAVVSRSDLCGVVLPLGDGVALAVKV